MEIVLIHLALYSPQASPYNCGLGYISSILKMNGYGVKYFVLKNTKDVTMLYENIKITQPEIIGFSVTSSQFNYLKNIVKPIKDISDSFILCGGVHFTLQPDCILEIPELDAIVRGEGEYPLVELLKAIENRQDYFKIKNFWFRRKGEIVKNELRPFIKNLNELPFPDKHYSEQKNRFIFSRGCIFECTYCSNKALSEVAEGSYFRQRSPTKAIEEIERDATRLNFTYIVFDDDTITLNKKWFYEFFALYKKTFRYPFRCNLRPGTVDSDMFKLLKECRVGEVGIGLEHGNEEFRKTVLKRNISNKQIIDVFKLCDKYNISHVDHIIVGFPFETKKLFLDTVRLSRRAFAYREYPYIFHPYPGTELGRICNENGWLPEKEYFREREEAVISFPNFKKEEIQLCRDVFPYLLNFRFIPLLPIIPLRLIINIGKFINKIKLKILKKEA